ncbi:hypothetical protein O7047_06435 [Pseudenterobacter timonensis]|uniref:Uncharacterized protein n=1 Tax=Pseudenterobacter timonensis TaxID=1755099 RepID=A0AAE4IUU7_9ENTR|nr:hypothetical protein [Pseudenterobacter timonensis]MDR9889872.1 hypothetical protein [Pseudenterobacter timonensis]
MNFGDWMAGANLRHSVLQRFAAASMSKINVSALAYTTRISLRIHPIPKLTLVIRLFSLVDSSLNRCMFTVLVSVASC